MGTRERRLREKRYRAEQIENAARKIFLEKGYEAATIQGIAREAELSIGTIYFYFKTKEEIFASINLKIIQKVEQGLNKILADETATIEEKLRWAWDLLYDVFCTSPLSRRALVHGVLQGSLQNISDPLLEKLNSTGATILKLMASLFRQAMDQGLFRETNEMALADLFWSTFTGVVAWEEAKQTTDPNKRFLKSTLDLAFDTFIQGRKARPKEA